MSAKKPRYSKSVGIKVKTYSVGSRGTKYKTGVQKVVDKTTVLTTRTDCDSPTIQPNCSDFSVLSTPIPQLSTDHYARNASYSAKKVAEIEDWSKANDEMLAVAVESNAPTSYDCGVCGVEVHEIIRCVDCGPFGFMCINCEKIIHKGRLHKPEIWKMINIDNLIKYTPLNFPDVYLQDGPRTPAFTRDPAFYISFVDHVFQPYTSAVQQIWHRAHECNSMSLRGMELYDEKGRRHFVMIAFCECESHAATLLRHGFWPSSAARPSAAFSMQLMRILHYLTLECAVSVKGYVQTLRWNHSLSEDEAKRLYQLLIGESVNQYRAFMHKYETVHDQYITCSEQYTLCPMCPKDAGVVTVSLDANFGLVRKHNAGTSFVESKYHDSYFVDRSEVDCFMNSYNDDKQTDKECNKFLAGDVVRTQSRNAKLDVRGVFGSVCRHELPVMFMDMKYGERLAYAVLMIRKLQAIYCSATSFQIVYDIACVLTRHLQRTKQDDLLQNMTLGLPVFHAYGHNAACQVKYSTRRLDAFGLTDGEATERLWSYVRMLAKVTKEMTPSHRTEMLDSALFHFKERKIVSLAKWIVMRTKRANDVRAEASCKLLELLQVTNSDIGDVAQWHVEQKERMSRTSKVSDVALSWEGKYVCQLRQYYDIRLQMSASAGGRDTLKVLSDKLQRSEECLRRLEKKHFINARWQPSDESFIAAAAAVDSSEQKRLLLELQREACDRAFIISLLSKYCDGQQSAIRLSRQLTKITKSVKKKIALYNDRRSVSTVASCQLPAVISFAEVTSPAGTLFSALTPEIESEGCTVPPWSVRCQAVDLYCLGERAAEEIQRLQSDVVNALQHYVGQYEQLVNAAAADKLNDGARALLLARVHVVQAAIISMWTVGRPMLQDTAESDARLRTLSDKCDAVCSSDSRLIVQAADDCGPLSDYDESDTESTDSYDNDE